MIREWFQVLIALCVVFGVGWYLHREGLWDNSHRYAKWCRGAWQTLRALFKHLQEFDARRRICRVQGHLITYNINSARQWCTRCHEVLK